MARMLKYVNGNLVEYEVFKLVDFYDPILRKPTELFDFNAPDAYQQASFYGYSLSETLQKYRGLGISANQVGINKRICVVNMGDKNWIMINPKITWKSEEQATFSEGCLSYPGLYLKVPRVQSVKVEFQALNGQWVEQQVDGLTAVCVQHELDHLDGVVYTDKVSPIKLDQAKKKVKKTLKKMSQFTVEDLKKVGLA